MWSAASRPSRTEGVPRDQIVVGVPFYGRGFTGVPDVNDGLYQPFTGMLSADYRTVKSDYLNRPHFRNLRHPEADVPWLYDPTAAPCSVTMIPYRSGARRTLCANQRLGGIMLWELSDDDEDASLLRAISSRLIG